MATRTDAYLKSRTFRKDDPWTRRIARMGAAASPWKRVPYKTTAIRTLRLQMLRDIGAGKTPRRIR